MTKSIANSDTLKVIDPRRIADARNRISHVFIRDLVLPVFIGIHGFEREAPQPVRFNIDLAADDADHPSSDSIGDVVDYEIITNGIRSIIDEGHVKLVETIAERIAEMALATNNRIRSVRVRVEKLEIVAEAESVGVEIERFRP